MSRREYKLFIEDILESIDLIEQYTEEMDFDSFKTDRKTVDAVVRNLEIIGEASKNIPENIRVTNSDIDWKGIIGLRNRIIHEYFGVDLSIIWNIIRFELPVFKKRLQEIHNKMSGK